MSRNAVIPIAYYFKETGLAAEDFLTDNSELSRIRRDIRRWFITSLLNGTLSGSADTVLTRIREVLQEEDGKAFPIGRINEEMRSLGKVIGFSEEIAENVLERTKGGSRAFLALTLLYDREDFGSIRHHQDHIFPKSRLATENLIERGISPERASEFEEEVDKLPNIQLLTRTENESKQDTPFEEWITQQSSSFYDRHLIPRDPGLHRVKNFEQFLKVPREKIKSKLMSILSAQPNR